MFKQCTSFDRVHSWRLSMAAVVVDELLFSAEDSVKRGVGWLE
jgi:hypothetical protein